MPIFDIFSKRQRRLRGEMPDVYVYDDLPNPLRVQIVHIWKDTLGDQDQYYEVTSYMYIVNTLHREYGVFQLHSENENAFIELVNFFLNETNVEKALDAVELSFQVIDKHSSNRYNAIKELNNRFKEHGVGYQFTDRQIVRIDSEFAHDEIVKPALRLLDQQHYAGAQQEFLKAHEHYRKGNAKEALSECLKAFESVMKSICDKRGWSCSNNATAKSLIQICFNKGLIPSFWQSHYSALRNLLESSVPTGRNKLSGHGQGTAPKSVPDHLVAYMLHMTASAIVFLAEADKNSP